MKKLISIEELEKMQKAGKSALVRDLLRQVNAKKISRENVIRYADLARRTNLLKWALLILRPLIYPKFASAQPASDKEKALYAHCLSKMGAFSESDRILNSISDKNDSQILFFKAANCIYQWNDSKAIKLLKKYISLNNISKYERQIGLVNLAESYLSTDRSDLARTTVSEILKMSDPMSEGLLVGYCHFLLAQVYTFEKKITLAEQELKVSLSLLNGSKSRYEHYVKSWRIILDLIKLKESK